MNKSLKALIVIPARYNSSRFPGKPLVKIDGIPMICRTFNQAKQNNFTKNIVVATDSKRIKTLCESNGIPTITTGECNTGTDRVAEVSRLMPNYNCYINLQGDEPVIDPKIINESYKVFINSYPKYGVVTAYGELEYGAAKLHKAVKVVMNQNKEAMYFSRETIPHESKIYNNHIGIYCFSKDALDNFSNTKIGKNEQTEKIEMIRMVELGIKVKMFKVKSTIAVDLPSDIKIVEEYLQNH